MLESYDYTIALGSIGNQASGYFRPQLRCRLQSIIKYYILHIFKTSTPSKEKPLYQLKDLHKLKLLTYFDVSLTASLGRVANHVFNL